MHERLAEEEKLLDTVEGVDYDVEEYVRSLQQILSSKIACLEKLQGFLGFPFAPENPIQRVSPTNRLSQAISTSSAANCSTKSRPQRMSSGFPFSGFFIIFP
jgi:hypothetical protein